MEQLWDEACAEMRLVPDDPAGEPIREFLIRFDGPDRVRFRY
jgi:hypothetical protein